MPFDPASLTFLFKPFIWVWKGLMWIKNRLSQWFLEEYKSKLKVRVQITLATYNHRREARQKIRTALSEIEAASDEAREAFELTLVDNHSEYEVMKWPYAKSKQAAALKKIEAFNKLVQDVQGDLGEASEHVVAACTDSAGDLETYLAFAFEKDIKADDLEPYRTAGGRLRDILATEDKNDSECLQQD